MTNQSRREFLRQLGTITAFVVAGRAGRSVFAAGEASPFEFLVVGDSLVWGQGLEEKDKFYSLTANWLRDGAFNNRREVNVTVNAHSGSTLKFHADEAKKYKKAGCDETFYHKPEVNVGFPSVWKQIEVAADRYKTAGISGGADLIMLTGGITDISVAKVLDPFGDNRKLVPQIEKYLRDDMFDVIEHAATNNPNALIAVVGYFPILSPKTPGSRLFNNWLESMSFPRALKPIANNGVIRPIFFSRLRKKGISRSRIWFVQSNRCLQEAVDKLNAAYDAPRAVFIKSPITEDTCLETPGSLLFRMNKKGVVEDPLYRERAADCSRALRELKKTTGIDYPIRLCEIAAVGHPNPAGSQAYAEAIKTTLTPILSKVDP